MFYKKKQVFPEVHVGVFSLSFMGQNWIRWLSLASGKAGVGKQLIPMIVSDNHTHHLGLVHCSLQVKFFLTRKKWGVSFGYSVGSVHSGHLTRLCFSVFEQDP